MMRALFAGVTGLRSHQTYMDVIGNNIANVNTTGYKKSSVTFSDLYSETVSSASAQSGQGATAVGGTNAMQIGLGSAVSSIVIKHTSGAAQYTGNAMDVAISGDGFFAVQTDNGIGYTRNGSFSLDNAGNLVTSNGNYVKTFTPVYNLQTSYDLGSAVTSSMSVTDVVGSATVDGDITVSGDDVNGHTYHLAYNSTDPSNPKWELLDEGGNIVDSVLRTDSNSIAADNTLTFKTSKFGDISITLASSLDAATDTDAELSAAMNGAATPASFKFSTTPVYDVEYSPNTGNLQNLTIDFSKYSDISIDSKGAIIAQLKTDDSVIAGSQVVSRKAGDSVVLGYIAIATFTNNEGLEKESNSIYVQSSNSGSPTYQQAGTGGAGSLNPSNLEMSNVDLSEEMVNMIITQRGFQANSRIITTTDTMLEELVNLKR